jgi:hypothetical protein
MCVVIPHAVEDLVPLSMAYHKAYPYTASSKLCKNVKIGFGNLELQHLDCAVTYTYKILFGHLNTQHNLFCNVLCSVFRVYPYQMFVPRCNSDVHKTFTAIKIFHH